MKIDFSQFHHARKGVGETVLLEGIHAVKHALRFEAEIIKIVTANKTKAVTRAQQIADMQTASFIKANAQEIDERNFNAIAPQAHTGVLALARKKSSHIPHKGKIVFLENPASIYNIGAVIRTAAAAPDGSAVLVSGSHNPWNSGTLRTAAGLHYALEAVMRYDTDELVTHARHAKLPLIALTPQGDPFTEPLPQDAILLFGTEREGISHTLLANADMRLSLPMRPNVSSLNLAASVAATFFRF